MRDGVVQQSVRRPGGQMDSLYCRTVCVYRRLVERHVRTTTGGEHVPMTSCDVTMTLASLR